MSKIGKAGGFMLRWREIKFWQPYLTYFCELTNEKYTKNKPEVFLVDW